MSLFPCYENEVKQRDESIQGNPTIIIGKSYQHNELIIATATNKSSSKVEEKKKKDGKKKKKSKERKHKKRKYQNEEKSTPNKESDSSDFDSFDESEHEYDRDESGHVKKKKLLLPNTVYLPNGNMLVQADQSDSQLWRIDKGKDDDFLLMGSFYRLDIPEYDICLFPNKNSGQVKKFNPINQKLKNHNTKEDSNRYTVRSRYYNDFTSQQWDLQIYRPRSIPNKGEKKSNIVSFMIPLPPPLPKEDMISSNDVLVSAMKTDLEISRKKASSLLTTINTLIRTYPHDSPPYIIASYSQGKVVWHQTIAANADKGTLSTLWRSITERQISIIDDGITAIKKHQNSSNVKELVPLYQLLIQLSILWQESVSDAVLGIPLRPEWEGQPTWKQILNIWQRCLADCALSQSMNRKYLQYQLSLPGSTSVSNRTLSLSSISPSTTSGLRSLTPFFCSKLQRDTKNLLIARSMSRQNTNSWFSGRSSISIPPRLQDDLDCSIADSAYDLISLEFKAGHTERAYAIVQSIFELNLSIGPLIQRGASSQQTEDEIRAIILNEFTEYWDSEHPRFGERRSSNIRTNSERGYLQWISLNRPVDGWASGLGITGNVSQDGTLSQIENEPELTGNQLFEAATNLMDQLLARFEPKEKSQSDSTDAPPVLPIYQEVQRVEQFPVESTKRKRAVEYFEYQDGDGDGDGDGGDSKVEAQANDAAVSRSRVESNSSSGEIDDGLVYSRVHGYRIKIDHQEDTSLAYKKVLGDIKDSDLTDLSTEDILKLSKEDEVEVDYSKHLSKPSSNFFKEWKKEDILHSLQWRPLRVNASTDSVAGEAQPNRVIFSEDVKLPEFVFMSLTSCGRERMIIRCLQVLGVKFSHLEISHHSIIEIDQSLPEYWSQLLQGCLDYSHQDRVGFLRHVDYLLSTIANNSIDKFSINSQSDYFSSLSEFETISSFSSLLILKHQCSVLLGVSSPLDFILQLIEDLLAIYDYWKAKNFQIFTQNFQRLLKSSFLSLVPIKLMINKTISNLFQRSTHEDPQTAIRNLSIELLNGEEINQNPRDSGNIPSMSVWGSYINAELLVSNHNQSRKALEMSLISLGAYTIRYYDSVMENNTELTNDLLYSCLASLTYPPNHQLKEIEWRAKELVKIKALFSLSSIPGALDLYWKGLRLLLSSVVPELTPSSPLLHSIFYNTVVSVDESEVVRRFISPQDIYCALQLVIQLTDGGTELSENKGLFKNKEGKKKKKKDDNIEMIPILTMTVDSANALLKLESLCEWIWQSTIRQLDQERQKCETEREINAVRVDIHQMNLSSSTFSSLSLAVAIFIWSTFLVNRTTHHCLSTRELKSQQDLSNNFHQVILNCDQLFLDWINKLKFLLFGDKIMTIDEVVESFIPQDSGGYRYSGLYEAGLCDRKYGYSIEEQQILLCIEQLHALRCLIQALLMTHICEIKITQSIQLRLFPMSSGQLKLREYFKKLRRKLFSSNFDAFGIFLQFSSDIYCASINSLLLSQQQHQQQHQHRHENQLMPFSNEIKYLCIQNWSHDQRIKLLQMMEKLLLRTLINSHPSSSFSSLLQNNLVNYSHPGDLGITGHMRSFPLLWKLYLTVEIIQIKLLTDQNLNTISLHVINEEIQKRLTLFFRGNELLSQGNEEILVGRNVSILQGSLRTKSMWMESNLGEIILLHYRVEKIKKRVKEEIERSDRDEGVEREEEEEEYLMKQMKSIMERREIMCRTIS